MGPLRFNGGWRGSLAVLPEAHDGLVQFLCSVCLMNWAVPKLFFLADDWSYERPSHSYFLGDLINIEASVTVYNHVPLRVFVDHCVATQEPDVTALPRYSFIENHG